MADDDRNETLPGAHTPGDLEPEPEKSAKIGDTRATAEAALDDLAGQFAQEPEPDQLDLLDDEECLFAGPVRHVAETFREAKGRGRPKGSKNKASQLFRDALLKMGYRHPGLNLADLANADKNRLAAELGCKPLEALNVIKSANEALMPYFESRRPQETVHTEQQMGVLIIHQTGAEAREDGVMSLTGEVRKSEDKSDT